MSRNTLAGFVFVFACWNFEILDFAKSRPCKSGLMPWPKAPLPMLVRARAREGGAVDSSSHRSPMPLSNFAFDSLSHRSPMPLSNFRSGRRRRGPCCGASVGTTCSAPLACAVPGPWCGASAGTTGSAPSARAEDTATAASLKKSSFLDAFFTFTEYNWPGIPIF